MVLKEKYKQKRNQNLWSKMVSYLQDVLEQW